MKIKFSQRGWEDYQYWMEADKRIFRRINALIADMMRQPFEGIGKPEALKHNLSGFWSRRINGEHRIVYYVEDEDTLVIKQCRYHY